MKSSKEFIELLKNSIEDNESFCVLYDLLQENNITTDDLSYLLSKIEHSFYYIQKPKFSCHNKKKQIYKYSIKGFNSYWLSFNMSGPSTIDLPRKTLYFSVGIDFSGATYAYDDKIFNCLSEINYKSKVVIFDTHLKYFNRRLRCYLDESENKIIKFVNNKNYLNDDIDYEKLAIEYYHKFKNYLDINYINEQLRAG